MNAHDTAVAAAHLAIWLSFAIFLMKILESSITMRTSDAVYRVAFQVDAVGQFFTFVRWLWMSKVKKRFWLENDSACLSEEGRIRSFRDFFLRLGRPSNTRLQSLELGTAD